ncbi:hypothetical protein BDQ17DRAFT_1435131 [Cyathus striatus]|nr:hypothetical protein BDQ17DRAFT_1435131 [Cyathus striatus]
MCPSSLLSSPLTLISTSPLSLPLLFSDTIFVKMASVVYKTHSRMTMKTSKEADAAIPPSTPPRIMGKPDTVDNV